MKRRNLLFLLCGFSLALVGTSQAAIVATDGMMTQVSPPLDLQLDQYESTLAVFLESQQPAGTWVLYDWLVPPPGPNPAGPYQGFPIAAGGMFVPLPIDVYMIHWDSFESTTGTANGSVTFSLGHEVLALITSDMNLDSSDVLGNPNVIYPFMLPWRGTTETVPGAGPDPINISPDRRTVSVSFTTTLATDQARLVVAIPEPGTLVLLGLGSFGLLTWRHRRHG